MSGFPDDFQAKQVKKFLWGRSIGSFGLWKRKGKRLVGSLD